MKTILKCAENLKDLTIDYDHSINHLKMIFRDPEATYNDKITALYKIEHIIQLMTLNLDECREIVCYHNEFQMND